MKTSFIATGDSFITRHIAADGYEGFDDLRALIEEHDVKFANLEMTFHRQEGWPAAASGGTWAMTDPSMLDDMLRFGFNLFNTANNHSGDFGQEGVSATIRHLNERGMTFAGTGNTLQEASSACFLETREARVALIGITATFDPAAAAGGQSGTMRGRPGLNPLRFRTIHHVNPEHFEMAKTLAAVSQINAKAELSIRNGYRPPFPEGTLPLGSMFFALTDKEEYNETVPNEKDLARTIDEIRSARAQADIVLVSLHAHEMRGSDSTVAAEFLETFSRACIDAGASVVIGHGPHELRGIEAYKNGLIFYSIGNFIFETETVALQPFDAFSSKGASHRHEDRRLHGPPFEERHLWLHRAGEHLARCHAELDDRGWKNQGRASLSDRSRPARNEIPAGHSDALPFECRARAPPEALRTLRYRH